MKYIILVFVLLFSINFSYAVNLNDPGDIDASWGMIIFAISIPFIAKIWVDHNEKEKEKNYELMQKMQIEKANYKPDLKNYHIEFLKELLNRVEYLKSLAGVPGCMKAITHEGLGGYKSIVHVEIDIYNLFKNEFVDEKDFINRLYSIYEVRNIKYQLDNLFEALKGNHYNDFLIASDDIINDIKELNNQYSIFSI